MESDVGQNWFDISGSESMFSNAFGNPIRKWILHYAIRYDIRSFISWLNMRFHYGMWYSINGIQYYISEYDIHYGIQYYISEHDIPLRNLILHFGMWYYITKYDIDQFTNKLINTEFVHSITEFSIKFSRLSMHYGLHYR